MDLPEHIFTFLQILGGIHEFSKFSKFNHPNDLDFAEKNVIFLQKLSGITEFFFQKITISQKFGFFFLKFFDEGPVFEALFQN